MIVYISKKSSRFRFLASLLFAAGTAAFLCFLLAGPKLGVLYDFLLRLRPAPDVSREILIVDVPSGQASTGRLLSRETGDGILEPEVVSSLLFIMSELNARVLIIQVPILGLSAGGNAGEEEILYRFEKEFSVLGRNIQNLFDAIRTGSLAPGESAKYVEELVEISEKGKNRLVSALVRRDTEGIIEMERAMSFFGHVRRPGDLRVSLIGTDRDGSGTSPESGTAPAGADEYSRVRRDADGIIRRAAPELAVPDFSEGETDEKKLDHVIMGALRERFKKIEIEYAALPGMKPEPVLAARGGPDGKDSLIPLDRNGAVLFEAPHKGADFRRIDISDFLAYAEADINLRRLLSEGESLGIFKYTEGEKRPDFLYDYALSLREYFSSTLVSIGTEEKKTGKQIWLDARGGYFSGLDDFLSDPAESYLIKDCEEIIAAEDPDSSAVQTATETRTGLIQSFARLRASHSRLLELREKLGNALNASFCILGGNSGPVQTVEIPRLGSRLLTIFGREKPLFIRPGPGDVEASALLANSILTGHSIRPGPDLFLFIGSLACAFLLCLFLKSLGAASTLAIGVLLAAFTGTGFSAGFVFSGFWLDPLVPSGSCAAAVLVSFVWALIEKHRYSRYFRLAYAPFVSRSCLKAVIRAGRPLPSQTVTVRNTIVAVKNIDPALREDTSAILTFQKNAADLFRKAGGTVTGVDGDMITASFGSPLERVASGGRGKISIYENNIYSGATAMRAVDFVSEIAQKPVFEFWCFGLDLGDCGFSWTAPAGYSAVGSPVQKARILARVAGRYNARILISESVNEMLTDHPATKKLGSFKEQNGANGEAFYRL